MRHKEQSTERNTDKGFLRTEPLGRLLLKLALPTVAAQLINMLYNIVDHDRFRLCGPGGVRRSAKSFYLYGKAG